MNQPHDHQLGELESFEATFPQIATLSIEGMEFGKGTELGAGRHISLNEKTTMRFLDCSNPMCEGGGYMLKTIISEMVLRHETTYRTSAVCRGKVGSDGLTRDCRNGIVLTISLAYRT